MNEMKVERIETVMNGIRVINFPKPEGAISTQTVASIAYAIPSILKGSIVIDYNKISPEIFKAIKQWYHGTLEWGEEETIDEIYPIVCPDCFNQLQNVYASETHTYDVGGDMKTLIVQEVPQRQCQLCLKLWRLDLLDSEMGPLLDDFFLFHLNGKIDIPAEIEFNILRKFKGGKQKSQGI